MVTIPVSFKTPSDTTPTIIVQGNAVTINEDTPAAFNFTHVIDPDVGDIQTTTINVLHGTLNLTSVAGLSSFSGYGTNSITIVGPTAAVDAIVDAGVTYTPNDDYSGSDTLTIKDTDSFGGSATQQIAITVKPNEAPVLTADISGRRMRSPSLPARPATRPTTIPPPARSPSPTSTSSIPTR